MIVPGALLPHLRRARDRIDRDFAQPLDLDALAAEARLSKFHFLRCFAAAYGRTPSLYLSERRIERAQDLLRATTLSVTEVCTMVGFESLGSFSTRFKSLVGVGPKAYQALYSNGAPRIPGCYVLMRGELDRAIPEKPLTLPAT